MTIFSISVACLHAHVAQLTGLLLACQGGYVFIGVSQFICLLAGLWKVYSKVFHKNRWKGGTWAMEESLSFWSHYIVVWVGVRVGLWFWSGGEPPYSTWEDHVLPGICLIVTNL